ncbi:serine hydrolase domain-containing protein [Microbacterium immunditiarum]|uniref:CubicO group peptidase (Beta-lactamase class C family) n=1 Tax=Microbacterium immunditiarum TaxID=337480 RepID=A0A7Y9KJN1_9MICO|nr:serine hydrolase domain-containing protein [Microbacterium immunditiarum]NYE19945.1 CubicO group peptidase (beta-lactamase class C family) [Microbacterium immunditiarum]
MAFTGERTRTATVMGLVALLAGAGALMVAPSAPLLGPETSGDPALAAAVRAAIDDPIGYNGLSVALIENGEVRYAGIGPSGAPGHPQIDEHTRFEIGSATKTFTAAVLADMIASGLVQPTSTLGELLPTAGPGIADITLEELASHRSGLPRQYSDGLAETWRVLSLLAGNPGNPYAGRSTEWMSSVVAPTVVPDAKAGTVEYSNVGMSLLGLALAERAGTGYPQLAAERVFEPLGMSDTEFILEGSDLPANGAIGDRPNGSFAEPWRGDGYIPAGIGTVSSAHDMAAFVSAVLDGSAPGVDAATPRFDVKHGLQVGYAWVTLDVDGTPITSHNGETGTFTSFIGFDPASKTGVVVLSNTARSVDSVGMRLLGVEALPYEPELATLVVTIVLLVASPLYLILLALRRKPYRWFRAAPDRLRVIAAVAAGVATLTLARLAGSWQLVPGWLWAVAVVVAAAGVAGLVLRWRDLRWRAGGAGWWRYGTTTFGVLASAALLALSLA